jgi:hypothetical protein
MIPGWGCCYGTLVSRCAGTITDDVSPTSAVVKKVFIVGRPLLRSAFERAFASSSKSQVRGTRGINFVQVTYEESAPFTS